MKNLFICIITILILCNNCLSQGSGHCLDFDGINDFVALSALDTNVSAESLSLPSTAITVEAWVSISSFGNYEGIVCFTQDNGSSEYGFQIGVFAGKKFYFAVAGGSYGLTYLQTTGTYSTDQLYHVAGVYDGTTMSIYVNGVLNGTSASQSGNIAYSDSKFRIGKYEDYNESYYLDGQVDEVRIWNTGRTEAQIRATMCKILDGTETGLTHYWNFDEGTGTSLNDIAGSINGSLTNMADFTGEKWILSKAPLGNASQYIYTNNWAETSINITSANNGSFAVDSVSGTPDGVHIYRVDSMPNSVSGISSGIGYSDVYYGSFIVGGTSPKYTAKYDYSNFDEAVAQEPNLLLNYRDNNADSSWINLESANDYTTNTLSELGLTSRGEFIISSSYGFSSSLPINLLNFTAKVINSNLVRIDWQTTTETNNDYFTLEKSKKGIEWEELTKIDGAGNSSSLLSYSSTDNKIYSGEYYYRLKQTDFDGTFSYSKIIKVKTYNSQESKVIVYPNPTNGQVTITGELQELEQIKVYNFFGKCVTNITKIINNNNTALEIDLSKLSNGTYYIKTKTTIKKVYKQ